MKSLKSVFLVLVSIAGLSSGVSAAGHDVFIVNGTGAAKGYWIGVFGTPKVLTGLVPANGERLVKWEHEEEPYYVMTDAATYDPGLSGSTIEWSQGVESPPEGQAVHLTFRASGSVVFHYAALDSSTVFPRADTVALLWLVLAAGVWFGWVLMSPIEN